MKKIHKKNEFQPNNSKKLSLKLGLGILLIVFSLSSVFAQPYPISFTISGCTSFGGVVNGNYTIDAENPNSFSGCPCYNGDNGGVIWGGSTEFFHKTGTCAAIPVGPSNPIYNTSSCDISAATSFTCDPALTLSNVQYPPAPIPTLSEWGLIILTLLLLTLGTLYLVQPNWRVRFEQEG